jgi:hypothetical protein
MEHAPAICSHILMSERLRANLSHRERRARALVVDLHQGLFE